MRLAGRKLPLGSTFLQIVDSAGVIYTAGWKYRQRENNTQLFAGEEHLQRRNTQLFAGEERLQRRTTEERREPLISIYKRTSSIISLIFRLFNWVLNSTLYPSMDS